MELGNFFLVPVNYLAVLVAAVVSMVTGFLWYGPLFGKSWAKLKGFTHEKQEKAKKTMTQSYAAMFVLSLIMAYVLFHLIWYAAPGSYTLFIALKTAGWAWIGFVAPVMLSNYLFSPDTKSIYLYYIEAGNYLVSLLAMATVFYFIR